MIPVCRFVPEKMHAQKFFPIVCACLFFYSCNIKMTEPVVVASSSWTAAYAQAAGAKNVVVLAPSTMMHPSEYELRPSDIPKLKGAKMVVYAGYEVMTERITTGLNLPPEKLIQVTTDYNYSSISKSVMELAALLETESIARENLLEIRSAFEAGRKAVKDRRLAGQNVVVHKFLEPLTIELGLVPIMVFGPGEPEALDILAVSKLNAAFIIDNRHNPVGLSLKQVLPSALYTQLLNFPGHLNTKSLSDVVRFNVKQLLSQ